MPYYGGCPYTRECISSKTGVSCGDCLPGLLHHIISGECIGSLKLLFATDRQTLVFFPKVEVDFDQHKYYGSAMDGVTQSICLTIGSEEAQLVQMVSGDFGLPSFPVSTALTHLGEVVKPKVRTRTSRPTDSYFYLCFFYRPKELNLRF